MEAQKTEVFTLLGKTDNVSYFLHAQSGAQSRGTVARMCGQVYNALLHGRRLRRGERVAVLTIKPGADPCAAVVIGADDPGHRPSGTPAVDLDCHAMSAAFGAVLEKGWSGERTVAVRGVYEAGGPRREPVPAVYEVYEVPTPQLPELAVPAGHAGPLVASVALVASLETPTYPEDG